MSTFNMPHLHFYLDLTLETWSKATFTIEYRFITQTTPNSQGS